MIGAWYIERIAAGARLDLEVDGRLPPPRMDMGGLGRLAGVGIVGWSHTEGEGLATRRGLVERWALPQI
jgi:hypothetical protein